MAEITAAIDETAAQDLIHLAEQVTIPPQPVNSTLGPFTVQGVVTVKFSGGTVDLIPPETIQIADLRLDYTLDLKLTFDPPEVCLPAPCVDVPCIGEVCLPPLCADPGPLPPFPVKHADFVQFTGDFKLKVYLDAGVWKVDVVILGTPEFQFGPATAALLQAIGAALALALAPIPLVGILLASIVPLVMAGIGTAGVAGLLGPILTPFVKDRGFNVYSQPQVFQVLPAAGAINPPVMIKIDAVNASVQGSDEDELVLTIDVSP